MIPQLVTVRVKPRSGRRVRVWVPVLPVLLILSPVLVLAVAVAAVACLVYRIRVFPALGSGWRIVSALPGTRFDLEYAHTAVLVSIR
jgi:hypothetical protein